MKYRFTGGAAVAIIALGLGSCSSADVTPPADGGTYGTIGDLKKAVESAGLLCPELVLDRPPSKFSTSSGSCSEDLSLAVYSTEVTLESQLEFWRPVGQRSINVGKNWTVVTADPKRLEKKLGGTVLHTGP
ncbi:hypothetical protein ASE96_09680 [Arthrobacter sp. Leaf69]|nr:hypothetical protein ASE96_09680 [Arthrobacter sp. Leaf69]